MHKTEQAVNEYALRGMREDVERTVNKLISVRQQWIVVGIVIVFVIYVGLAVWIGIMVDDVKKDTFDANNIKRELAVKADSIERAEIAKIDSLQKLKIQEEREQISYSRKTDSLKRIKIFEINDSYQKTIEEWKKNRK